MKRRRPGGGELFGLLLSSWLLISPDRLSTILFLLVAASLPHSTHAQSTTSSPPPSSITAPPTLRTSCPDSFVFSCLSTAIAAVCPDTSDVSCICGPSGAAAIATTVENCVIVCPLGQLLELASSAGQICSSVFSEWERTHTPAAATGVVGGTGGSSNAVPGSTGSPRPPEQTNVNGDRGISSGSALKTGPKVGIVVGALVLLSLITGLAVVFLRRRRRRRAREARAAAEGIPTEMSHDRDDADLPPYSKSLSNSNVVRLGSSRGDIELQQLTNGSGFHPWDHHDLDRITPVHSEAASARSGRSVRSGRPTGDMSGTETTRRFDIDGQKVLLDR